MIMTDGLFGGYRWPFWWLRMATTILRPFLPSAVQHLEGLSDRARKLLATKQKEAAELCMITPYRAIAKRPLRVRETEGMGTHPQDDNASAHLPKNEARWSVQLISLAAEPVPEGEVLEMHRAKQVSMAVARTPDCL